MSIPQVSFAEYNIHLINNTGKILTFDGGVDSLISGCRVPDSGEYQAEEGEIAPFESKKIFENDFNYWSSNEKYCYYTMITDPESKDQMKLYWEVISKSLVKAEFTKAGFKVKNSGDNAVFFESKPETSSTENNVVLYKEDNITFSNDEDRFSVYSVVVDDTSELMQKIDDVYFVIESESSAKKFNRESSGNTLTSLSYNVKVWPPYSGIVEAAGGIYDNKYQERSKLIGDLSHGYDIVAYQEFFDRCERLRMIEDMKASGEYPYSVDAIGSGRPCDYKVNLSGSEVLSSGVLLLSHWLIVESEQREFSQSSGTDAMARKGITYAKVDKNGSIFHVFATHTQAGQGEDERNIRKAQFTELVNYINEKAKSATDRVIVLGDLNVDLMACQTSGNCDEFNNTVGRISNFESINWSNNDIIPFSLDGSKNTMMSGDETSKKKYLDYILYHKDFSLPSSAENRLRIMRGLNSEKMYSDKSDSLKNTIGRIDLSDHFAIESKAVFN